MNQRGDITLLTCALLLTMTSLVLLCALELQKKLISLSERSHHLLCTKEAKEEFHLFMKFMGKSNWAIQNIQRASIVMLLIPGLQKASFDAQKAKRHIQKLQELKRLSYLKKITQISRKNCSLDPRLFITPFKLQGVKFKRDSQGAVILRNKKWSYKFLKGHLLISIDVDSGKWLSPSSHLLFMVSEKKASLP